MSKPRPPHLEPLEDRAVPSSANPTFHAATGVGGAAIQAAVDAYRADLGDPNNGTAGPSTVGRREINWDGVPDAKATPNTMPPDLFRGRGAVFASPGTGFLVSAKDTTPVPPRFGDVNPSYSTVFQTFSAQRLFTARSSNFVEVSFFVPGTNTPAGVRGFGAVFTDVDVAGSTKLEFLDAAGRVLVSRGVPATPGDGSLSFLGLTCPPGSTPIARVRITCGGAALGVTVNDVTQSPGSPDLVVMDDFLYAEPQALPNATFSGAVFEDFNSNGKRDTGEAGIADVSVFLDADGDGLIGAGEATGTTGSDGRYLLIAPSATSRLGVVAIAPTGLLPTNSPPAAVDVQPGITFTDVDLGFRRPADFYAVGPGSGGGVTTSVFKADGTPAFSFGAFEDTFGGGVRVATGDVNGDGVPDTVVGAGPGIATQVRVIDGKTQIELKSIAPFEAAFTGGVFVAVGDVNADGFADVAIAPDEGGGPRVRLFSGKDFSQIADFFGIEDPAFRGGARLALADVNDDGADDLLVAAGFGGGPRLAGFSGASLSGTPVKLFDDFFVFEQTLRNGIFIAGGDLDGDGFADVVAGGGPGGGPRVFALNGRDLVNSAGKTQTVVANFFAGNVEGRGGVRVAARDLGDDQRDDLIVGDGAGVGATVTIYAGKDVVPEGTPAVLRTFVAIPDFTGGVFVG